MPKEIIRLGTLDSVIICINNKVKQDIDKFDNRNLENDRNLMKVVFEKIQKKDYEQMNIIERHNIENTVQEYRKQEAMLNE